MALLGGGVGGAGNPVGGSFTGPAETLEIIGDHGYAYAGEKALSAGGSADVIMLNFTSGNYYFVGTMSYTVDGGGSGNLFIDISMNDTLLWSSNYQTPLSYGNDQALPLIIPPYTQFELKMGSEANENGSIIMTGRIYRS